MDTSYVEAIRLVSFKSYRDASLPLGELALLVGRNGSGKSNALDGLWALARLVDGDDVREALDGGRDGPAVRGGALGCAPFGETSFGLGCTVRTGATRVEWNVTVQVAPVVQVVAERLAVDGEEVLASQPPRLDSADLTATWAGSDDPVAFRASRPLVTQVPARIPATGMGQQVHLAATQVVSALRSVFVLDPVPHQMRGYVPRRDVLLRRSADNLSAAVASLLEDPATLERLRTALGELNEQDVRDLTISRSELDDVMLTLVERFGGHDQPVPARVMSDGTLRFLAVLVALLQAPTIDIVPQSLAADDAVGQTMLVIEELENGLHASQAQHLVGLIRDEVRRRRVRVLATAHSPALLDALDGDEHRNVVVCQRDPDGRSTLTPLVELPGYAEVIARGGLGHAVVDDRLRSSRRVDPLAALDEILGRPLS